MSRRQSLTAHGIRPGKRRGGMVRLLAAPLAMLALAIQCFLVQPHVDAAALHLVSSSGYSSAVVEQSTPDGALCVICQEAVMARGVALTAPPAIPIASEIAVFVGVQTTTADVQQRASHHWRSRAPPFSA